MSMAMAGLLPRGGGVSLLLPRSPQIVGAAPTTVTSFPRHLRRHHRRHLTSILVSTTLRFPGRRIRRLFCEPRLEQDLAVEDSSAPATATVPPPTPAPPSPEEAARNAADLLDFRVGRVLNACKHPEADSLYVEEVDVGEPEPRTICSGLVKYIALDDLQGKDVVVLANLKPRNMRGVKSNGMLMAASDAAHENVELLEPSAGSVPGERIWFGSEEERGQQPDVATPNQVQKKKIWESVQPHLKTTESCEAILLGSYPMRTQAGVVISKTLKNANIA